MSFHLITTFFQFVSLKKKIREEFVFAPRHIIYKKNIILGKEFLKINY